jgi:hypothetical protein
MTHPNDAPSPRLDPTHAQSEPIEDGALEASDEDKIAGIVAQTRQDLAGGHQKSARELLQQRFDQSGIEVESARVAQLAEGLEADTA